MNPVEAAVTLLIAVVIVLWGGDWLLGEIESWLNRRRRERLR